MKRRISEWTYVELTLAAFVFVPEIRRLFDWRGHFSVINVFGVIPIAMLVPILFIVIKRRNRLRNSSLTLFLSIWVVGFGYASLAGIVQRAGVAGIFGLTTFVLPLIVGVWLTTRPESMEEAFERISNDLLIWGGVAGAYGIFQYIVAPPWDTAWMQSISAASFGDPVPFGIRVFSVLNGPGIFAYFITMSMLFSLPSVRVSRPWTFVAVLFEGLSLLLSQVRIGWIMLAVGLIVIVALSPDRRRAFLTLGLLIAFIAGSGALLFPFVPESVRETFSDRILTLTNVQDDGSAVARQETGREALLSAQSNPGGFGLGSTGPANVGQGARSVASGLPSDVIDNGYISRLVEMGFPGFALFFSSICLSLITLWRGYLRYARLRRTPALSIIASAIAVQISMILGCLAGDIYQSLSLTLFGISIALPLMRLRNDPSASVGAQRVEGQHYATPRSYAR